tara:strand:- start:3076 stop:3348 length:273 start_codon:yes stop_codon:yes gene_type:complete
MEVAQARGFVKWPQDFGRSFEEENAKPDSYEAVYTVYIKPECRSQGIAKTLIECLIQYARKDLLYIRLKVTRQIGDDTALKLYEKLGFQP